MQNDNDQTVFIVDDDAAVRDSLSLLLGLRGYRTVVFASAEDFLSTWKPEWAGCVLVDIRMPGMSGLELQAKLADAGCGLPVIVITAHGDAASARAALKGDAVDFLEKPIDDDQLMAAVAAGLERLERRRSASDARRAIETRLARLTSRERQVMDLVARGLHNREIAEELGISPRTVEVYKARMMEKVQVRNLSEIIRLAMELERASAASAESLGAPGS